MSCMKPWPLPRRVALTPCASPHIGVVLGDMNLKNVEVENVMHTLSQPQLEVAILGSDTQGCIVDP